MPNVIFSPPTFFDNTYQEEWLDEDFTKAVLKDIDKGSFISHRAVDTEVLGVIPLREIAGGTKTLILMNFDDEHIFNASACGDNCAKWILEIAKKKDLTINLNHIMHFEGDFEAKILNNGKIVHNFEEFLYESIEFL